MRKEIIETLFRLCLEINGLSPVKKGDTSQRPTVCLYFGGHAASLTIEVFGMGWTSGACPDMRWQLYTDAGMFDFKEYEKAYDSLMALHAKTSANVLPVSNNSVSESGGE